jgi:hypothetical protein
MDSLIRPEIAPGASTAPNVLVDQGTPPPPLSPAPPSMASFRRAIRGGSRPMADNFGRLETDLRHFLLGGRLDRHPGPAAPHGNPRWRKR